MRKFVRTRRAPPAPLPAPGPGAGLAAHSANGHANGGGNGAGATAGVTPYDECRSSLSSWSGPEGGAGAGGGAGGGPLWEDPEFPAGWRALGDRKHSDVVWLRPHEICAAPRFRGDSALAAPEPEPEPADRFAARWRVEVGGAGVAALCSAAGALALTPRLLTRAAPHQAFHARYTGAFTFRFWSWAGWRAVVVDDRLPARRGRLLASRSQLRDDFTLPLLEKAYAKLHGSYRAARARGGGAGGALRALSGGAVQAVALRGGAPAPLLAAALPRSTLLLASPHQETGEAWVVTGLARARRAGGGEQPLVRVRAVGGVGAGAGGVAAGGVAARAWAALPAADRALLPARPGELWLSAGELARAFAWLQVAHVGPDDWLLEPALAARRPWRCVLARRRWRPHYNAGGPPTSATTGANPQFLVEVGGSGEGEGEGACHVVVSVARRRGAGLRPAGAAVYALGAGTPRAGELPPGARALDVTHTARAEEVVSFFTVGAGRYLVVPHAPRAAAGAFLLRVYTDAHATVREVNDDNLVVRNIADEREDAAADAAAPPLPRAMRAALDRVLRAKHDGDDELEVEEVRLVLAAGRRWWGAGAGAASRGLARALAAPGTLGRLPAASLPPRARVLRAWREAWRGFARGCGGAGGAPALRLRALLRAGGATASNKVAEALAARWAPAGRLSCAGYQRAMLALHLAHGTHYTSNKVAEALAARWAPTGRLSCAGYQRAMLALHLAHGTHYTSNKVAEALAARWAPAGRLSCAGYQRAMLALHLAHGTHYTSNKVAEALAARWAPAGRLSCAGYQRAMLALHLAHGTYYTSNKVAEALAARWAPTGRLSCAGYQRAMLALHLAHGTHYTSNKVAEALAARWAPAGRLSCAGYQRAMLALHLAHGTHYTSNKVAEALAARWAPAGRLSCAGYQRAMLALHLAHGTHYTSNKVAEALAARWAPAGRLSCAGYQRAMLALHLAHGTHYTSNKVAEALAARWAPAGRLSCAGYQRAMLALHLAHGTHYTSNKVAEALAARWAPAGRLSCAGYQRAMLALHLAHGTHYTSNKVAEALAARWAPAGRLSCAGYQRAMLALHLAHDRYRQLDSKLKSNPLSLEEMILMTIYS